MDGIPTQTETINGVKAINASNDLYGIQANNNYYTFDIGWSVTLVGEFNVLVHSVKFTK